MTKKNRARQASPGRLSVMRLSLVAAMTMMASAEAAAACVRTFPTTTIFSNLTFCSSWTGGNLTLSNTGVITGGATTALTAMTSGETLTNQGTIQSNIAAILNIGTIGVLDNSGAILGGQVGNGAGINTTSLIRTLTNSGTISGSSSGIANAGTIMSLNNISGTVSGAVITGTIGIDNTSFIGTITNTGTIGGNAATIGVSNSNASTITSLNNNIGGVIAGVTGIANFGNIGTLTNSGLIQGTGAAINIDNGGGIGVIANNGGTIAGAISNTGSDLTITGGAGSTFGTLTGASGGIGRIVNTASNLVFSAGNQLLNDNINVTGHTAINSGSVLQVNNRVTITGNYTQNAGGTLNIGVADGAQATGVVSTDSGYGRLVVSGAATFDAGSSIALKKLNTYAFAQGQRFVVVQADNANAHYNTGVLNYSADGFTGSVTGSSVVDTGNANKTDLIITLAAGGSTAPVNNATNSDASAALGGLFNYTGNNAGLLAVFNPAAALGTSGAANKAGAQLSPAATGSAAVQAAQSATQGVADVANAHIDTLRVAQASGSNSGNSGVATGERPTDVAVWGQAFGGQSTQNDRAGAAGYKAGVNGMLVGVDTAVSDQWRVGGLVDYANISIANTGDNTGSSGHVTSYGVLGYAGYAAETWYLNLSAGVASQKYNTLRVVNFTGFSGGASGSFDGTDYSVGAQAGYPIKLDAATTLTPIGRLMYQRLHQDGYTETGSAAALQIGSASTTSIKSDLGAKLERMFKTSYGDMTPSAQLSWRHEYRDTVLRSAASFAADTTGSTGFVSQGAAPEKDTGVLVLGVTLARSQNLTLAAHYTLEAAGSYTSQIADVKLRYQF